MFGLNLKKSNKKEKGAGREPLGETAQHLPEKGPIDDQGREILLSLKNVDITFGKGDHAVRAVKNASFDIYKGETFSLVGESGSGKTTIGRAVIRVNPCAAGEIDYKGVRISGKIPHSLDREVIRNVQMVFQDPAASLNERATVDYIISEGLYNFKLFENEADRVNKVETMIKEVGLLPEHLTRYPHEFSGGQRQRIGLARAMIMEPELVVADEPISALDVSIRAQVLNLLKKFQKERDVTYLFIAHDLSIVRFISDRIGVIYKGDIVEIADATELFEFPLHPYTRSLISAIPIPDPKLEKNKILFTYDPSVHDRYAEHYLVKEDGSEELIEGEALEAALAAQAAAMTKKSKADKPDTVVEPASGENVSVDAEKVLKADEASSGNIDADVVSGGAAASTPAGAEAKDPVDVVASEDVKERGANIKPDKSEAPIVKTEKPTLCDIGHNHFVFGYKKEIERYKDIRERGEQVKSVTIVDPDTAEGKAKLAEVAEQQRRDKESGNSVKSRESILDRPIHDTGNILYLLLSLILPIVGLIMFPIFKAHNYILNYKACRKGTIIGLCIIAAVIVFYGVMLLFTLV